MLLRWLFWLAKSELSCLSLPVSYAFYVYRSLMTRYLSCMALSISWFFLANIYFAYSIAFNFCSNALFICCVLLTSSYLALFLISLNSYSKLSLFVIMISFNFLFYINKSYLATIIPFLPFMRLWVVLIYFLFSSSIKNSSGRCSPALLSWISRIKSCISSWFSQNFGFIFIAVFVAIWSCCHRSTRVDLTSAAIGHYQPTDLGSDATSY